jgi:hypothetical protein
VKRVRYSTFMVDVGARRYLCDCRVHAPRAAAHAGADSPRYMDPGSPGHLELLRVRHSGIDVSPDADLRLLLQDRCAGMAGVSRGFVRNQRDQRVLEFAR